MQQENATKYIAQILENLPSDWLTLTTHRLDIYNEDQAKTEFLTAFDALYQAGNNAQEALAQLPTAYDYIRLGHPLSCVLEWTLAQMQALKPTQVIAFASRSMPLLAVLRTNLLEGKNTRIAYSGKLPEFLDWDVLKQVYGYRFTLEETANPENLAAFEGSTVWISMQDASESLSLYPGVDFHLNLYGSLGAIMVVSTSTDQAENIAAIQHVRRRESIAMTPTNCNTLLRKMVGLSVDESKLDTEKNTDQVRSSISEITATETPALLASSGLSMQYAIMMGLVDYALHAHPGKAIKIIVPPNCYGGTNDQARRVAAAHAAVSIMDLPVDGDSDMVQSTGTVLAQAAEMDAVPLIIAEIPTNPRVEVPDLEALRQALTQKRMTPKGETAVAPVFILDQTFCPNVQFMGSDGILSEVQGIAYVSGSKFPSGGKCTAGYAVANTKGAHLMEKMAKHLRLCDNQATDLQVAILAEQLPSMNQRIYDAYVNTRDFVNYIAEQLPTAKINFVSEKLAEQGFTPSVFSLDLPTQGETPEAREAHKRMLNQKLIDAMITQIPQESKYCVSYGQLKGCYWTIPATSTQGTTKEADKDYIARVSVSAHLDLDHHKAVFKEFVEEL